MACNGSKARLSMLMASYVAQSSLSLVVPAFAALAIGQLPLYGAALITAWPLLITPLLLIAGFFALDKRSSGPVSLSIGLLCKRLFFTAAVSMLVAALLFSLISLTPVTAIAAVLVSCMLGLVVHAMTQIKQPQSSHFSEISESDDESNDEGDHEGDPATMKANSKAVRILGDGTPPTNGKGKLANVL